MCFLSWFTGAGACRPSPRLVRRIVPCGEGFGAPGRLPFQLAVFAGCDELQQFTRGLVERTLLSELALNTERLRKSLWSLR